MPQGTCFKKLKTVSTRFPKDSKRNSPNYKNVIDTKIRHDIKHDIKRGEQLPAATLAREKSEHIKLPVCMNGISREKKYSL